MFFRKNHKKRVVGGTAMRGDLWDATDKWHGAKSAMARIVKPNQWKTPGSSVSSPAGPDIHPATRLEDLEVPKHVKR